MIIIKLYTTIKFPFNGKTIKRAKHPLATNFLHPKNQQNFLWNRVSKSSRLICIFAKMFFNQHHIIRICTNRGAGDTLTKWTNEACDALHSFHLTSCGLCQHSSSIPVWIQANTSENQTFHPFAVVQIGMFHLRAETGLMGWQTVAVWQPNEQKNQWGNTILFIRDKLVGFVRWLPVEMVMYVCAFEHCIWGGRSARPRHPLGYGNKREIESIWCTVKRADTKGRHNGPLLTTVSWNDGQRM